MSQATPIDIGSEVWTTHHVLKHGRIALISTDPGAYLVEYEGEENQWLSTGFVHASKKDAQKACQESSDYWQRKADELA